MARRVGSARPCQLAAPPYCSPLYSFYYSLLAPCYAPLTPYYLLRTTYYAPLTMYHSLRTTYYAPRTTYHLPLTPHYATTGGIFFDDLNQGDKGSLSTPAPTVQVWLPLPWQGPGSAPAVMPCLLSARLAAPGSSALPGRGPAAGASQPPPRGARASRL